MFWFVVKEGMNERRNLENNIPTCSVKKVSHIPVRDFFPSTQQNVLQTSPDEMMADFGVDRPLRSITSCAICLGDYTHGEAILTSNNCQHVFDTKCIMQWLVKHQECPCCRTDFGDIEQEVPEPAPDLSTQTTTSTSATVATTTTTTTLPI
jgi:hypothetical protein